MRAASRALTSIALSVAALAAGCALHPAGESEERERAEVAGRPFEKSFEARELPPLAADAPWPELLRRAFLANAELERRYREWQAALERIPQEASPRTTGAFFFDHMISGGSATFWDRTTAAFGNDPMFNLPWPGKLTAAGRIALAEARAAGLRFEEAKFTLQRELITAYLEWALLAEEIRIQEMNLALLETVAGSAAGRTRAGVASQVELLAARTERDLARSALASLESRVPGRRARLNALLSRPADAELTLPAALPPARRLPQTDAELIALAAERNPELRALAEELIGKEDAIELAKLEFVPEFGASVGADLGGMAQSLAAMVTVPFFRYEAITAGIREARARLEATRAMLRSVADDLAGRVVADIHALRDTQRQVELFADVIVPSAEQVVATSRAAYASAGTPLVELLDRQRTLLDARLTLAMLRAEHGKLVAELEALAALDAGS